ncbi:MAG: ParB-like protein [Steroidobacteraceae bacterium]
MKAHPMPAVVGPQGKLYLTDHHHLGRAALDARVSTGLFLVEADLSECTLEAFWKEMNENLWVHPLDENGVRHCYSMIPDKLGKLIDDLHRSLACRIHLGGFLPAQYCDREGEIGFPDGGAGGYLACAE